MAKTLGIVIGIVLVVALGVFLMNSLGKNNDGLTGNAVAGDSENEKSNVKTFEISGGNFKFLMNGVESPELKVKQGDTVRIEFINKEGFHDFVIDEFTGARTKQMAAPGSETIE